MPLTSAITVDQVPAQSSFRTLILTGKNTGDIATIVVSGVPNSVIQPTNVTWRTEIRLSPGINRIEISGIDVGGNSTEVLVFEIELFQLVQRQQTARMPLDEHGVMLAVPRLPGEKSLPYLNRLKDTGLHPSDTTVEGVTFGAGRGIALQTKPAMILVSPLDVDTQDSRAVDGSIRIGPIFLEMQSIRLLADECLTVEPATQEIQLVNKPATSEVRIVTLNGDEVPADCYEVDRDLLKVKFVVPDFNGIDVHALFRRVERITLAGLTLLQLKTAIEAVVDDDGDPLFAATLLLPGSTNAAENLIPTKGFISVRLTNRLFEACLLRVRELHDFDFQQANLNSAGHAIGTKLEAWAQQVNTQARVVWASTFLGESFWEPLGEEPRLGVLPHLTDAARGHWRCGDPTDETEFTLKDFRANNGLCPVDGTPLEYHGIFPLEFQSGTGTGDDLKVRDIVAVQTEG